MTALSGTALDEAALRACGFDRPPGLGSWAGRYVIVGGEVGWPWLEVGDDAVCASALADAAEQAGLGRPVVVPLADGKYGAWLQQPLYRGPSGTAGPLSVYTAIESGATPEQVAFLAAVVVP